MQKALGNVGWNKPTKIQKASIEVALQGRDICACATTGSGKTGAFVLPILHRFALIDPSKNYERFEQNFDFCLGEYKVLKLSLSLKSAP